MGKQQIARVLLLAFGSLLLFGCVPPGPSVDRVFPGPSQTGVDRKAVIRFEFDEAVDPSTLVDGKTVLLQQAGRTLSGDLLPFAGNRAFLYRPHFPLAPLAAHSFQLGQGIQNRSGRPLSKPWSSSFTTGSPSGRFDPFPAWSSPGRFFHSATLLADGRVLVAGGTSLDPGNGIPPLPSADAWVIDFRNGFRKLVTMRNVRIRHTATVLTSGRVLLTGGDLGPSSELFDPGQDLFLPGPTLQSPRMGHTATRLRSGKILLTGGLQPSLQGMKIRLIPLQSAELIDPIRGISTPLPSMSRTRYGHTATLLADGRVLLAGGTSSPDLEIYDPKNGLFSSAGRLLKAREDHRANRLASGEVLFTGGTDPRGRSLAHAERYNPRTATSRATLGLPFYAREDHRATVLANGKILLTGGENNAAGPGGADLVHDSAELYDPNTDRFLSAGTLSLPRDDHSAIRLNDGRIFLLGGEDDRGRGIPSGELYRP